jgi:DNA-binding XRE family transcriptional regulator
MAFTAAQLKRLRSTAAPNGNRVAAAIEISELTQVEVARIAGVSPQYVCDLKAGRRNPSLDNARLFAEAFGCSIEDLFPRREAMAS